MHDIQKKILSLAQLKDINDFSYRQLAGRVGCDYPAQARHHLQKLIRLGYFREDSDGKLFLVGKQMQPGQNQLLTLPVLGEADCGEATRYASDEIQGYISVSPTSLHCQPTADMFVLKARGNSMNKARINGRAIEDSDYVVVKKCTALELKNGDYVVSIFDGLANIKKFYKDDSYRRLVLLSESFQDYPPIIIAEEDIDYYQPVGKVIAVLKGTNHLS